MLKLMIAMTVMFTAMPAWGQGSPQPGLSADAQASAFLTLVPIENNKEQRQIAEIKTPSIWASAQVGIVFSSALLTGGVGMLMTALVEAHRADEVYGRNGCTELAECQWRQRRYEYRAGLAGHFAYTSAGLFAGAVVTGVPAFIGLSTGKKTSGVRSFRIMPTMGGIRLQGTW